MIQPAIGSRGISPVKLVMTKLTFGMSFHETYQYSRQGVTDYARAIESLGFDTLWITENVHSGADSLEPLTTLSFMAAHTERVTLGPSVILLPLRNAVGLAHSVATLDRLSEGRLIFGVGTGGNVPGSFEAYGASLRTRGRYCDESLEVMKALSTGEPVTYAGKLLELNDYVLGGRPAAMPHPPIWVGGTAKGVLKRVASLADGFIPHSVSPELYQQLWRKIEGYCEAEGRNPTTITKAIQFYFCIADTPIEAQRIAENALEHRYQRKMSLAPAPDTHYAIGPPDEIARTIRTFADIGVTHFAFSNARGPGEVIPQIQTLATQIIPHFH